KIMTGAPIPPGADAVVMVEETEKTGVRGQGVKGTAVPFTVRIFREAKIGDNIRKTGEDFKKGDVVLTRGSVIRPAEIAMLAAIGRSFVRVYQRPRVAIVSTGDELLEIDETPVEGKIFNTNSYTLFAQVKECGAEPVHIGIARDNKEDLKEKLTFATASDCIICSGGVSVGEFDYVKDVLKEMGTEMRFWKVAIKPGKPLTFGVIAGKPAFGLPGNPISSMVAFEEFVRPALLKMMGRKDIFRRTVEAILTTDIKKKPGRKHFLRARLESGEKGYHVTPLEGQGSGILSSMVKANSLILLPEDGTLFSKDTRVKVQPLDDSLLFQGEPGY
ncbi:MAG: molybdopterin molybdotransferase MoeA, partial [Deltaproteobacteria bacterium]|nr:molybdopterin molybdotransferase MoeA [Deltaproteobacteria bacterium]